MGEMTGEEAPYLLWGADTRTCGPSGLPEPVPPAGDETAGYGPATAEPGPVGGESTILGVGDYATVTSWVPCFAGTSSCTGGRHLNVARVNVIYNTNGTASATVVPYFPTGGGYCGTNREVGPIFRNSGKGFLNAHRGNTWFFGVAQDGGGETWMEVPTHHTSNGEHG